jgi:FkbM family methyltransferase
MDIPWILKNRILKPYNHERQFEVNIQRLLLPLRGDVFWDVGANVGLYSLLLRKNFRHVFAVEPNPVARRNLKARLLWHFARNVTILPFALSDQNGETRLSPGSDRFQAWSKLHESGIRVKTATFDSIYQRSVDLMKIDVEGAEFMVLQGAKDALQRGRIMNLLIEVHSWDREKELEEILTNYGYRCEWMRTQELHVFARRIELASRRSDAAGTRS